MAIKRSLVIGAYAEEKFIGNTLRSLHAWLKDHDWLEDTEVIVITADAKDRTHDIVADKLRAFRYHKHIKPGPRVGKGRDIRLGFEAAHGQYALFMDADMATPLYHLEEAFNILEQKGGVVIGVRQITKVHKTFLRRLSSVMSNTIIRLCIGWRISDSQCGFKGFTKEALEVILPRAVINNWGFDFEYIKIASIHKLPVSLLPIPDWADPKDAGEGLSGDSTLASMKKTFGELLTVMRKQLKGDYK